MCERDQHRETEVGRPAFDALLVAEIEIGELGERFLRESAANAKPPDVGRDGTKVDGEERVGHRSALRRRAIDNNCVSSSLFRGACVDSRRALSHASRVHFPAGRKLGGDDADDARGLSDEPAANRSPRSGTPDREHAASDLAHAVNNPLFVIVANLELLRELLSGTLPVDGARAAEARDLVADAEDAATKLTETFAGAFPVVPRKASRAARFPDEPPTTRRPKKVRVLVVDDEPGVARALKRCLRDYDVRTLNTAKEAMALLSKGERFDVIISDLMMPEMTGMDLHEAVARLDREQAERMIFITGGAITTRARDFVAAMSDRVFEKPFSTKRLHEMLRRRVATR